MLEMIGNGLDYQKGTAGPFASFLPSGHSSDSSEDARDVATSSTVTFPGLQTVAMGFHKVYWVLPSFTEGITKFHGILLGFTGFY